MTTRTKWIILIIFSTYVVIMGTMTINNIIKVVTTRLNNKCNQEVFDVYTRQ